MVKHVVMWKVRGPSPAEKLEQAERIRSVLHALAGKIPGMSELVVGLGTASGEENADVVLVTTHESWQALAVYQEHPEHQAVARVIGELRVERRVVDFEL